MRVYDGITEMALRDLIASKANLTEEVIEQLIASYVRYDVDKQEIGFTPEAHGLSNKSKVLIYLVALQGWPFVTDEKISSDAKPAELEEQTGITGGSLRPLLKDLKDRNVIVERDGRYSVRPGALNAIRNLLQEPPFGSKHNQDNCTDQNSNSEPERQKSGSEIQPNGRKSEKAKKVRTGSGAGVAERFQSLVSSGFFAKAKSLAEVQAQLHKDAIIIPQTSLPSYLLKAVRTGDLEREKVEMNGKFVWAYVSK